MTHSLVTSAAGFFVCRLSAILVEQGHTVTGVDNKNHACDVHQNHPAHHADILAKWVNICKTKHLLGWEPQVELVEWMEHLVDWQHIEGDWAKEVAAL
jgi:nucleoside-diphosphate-sugar epimerase